MPPLSRRPRPALNQFAEDRLNLDVGVAGDAGWISACAKLCVGGCVDLYLSIGKSRRSGTHECIAISRCAADPHLQRSLTRANLIRDRCEIQRVAATAITARRRHRAKNT